MANEHWLYGRDFKGQFTSAEKESEFLERRAKWARKIDEAMAAGHRGPDLFRAVHGYDVAALGIGGGSTQRTGAVKPAVQASKPVVMGRATAAVFDEVPVPEEWEVDADPVDYDAGWED